MSTLALKNEIRSIFDLFCVKVRLLRVFFICCSAAVVLLLLGSMVPLIAGATALDTGRAGYGIIPDFGTLLLFLQIAAYLIFAYRYRRINEALSVFPQSNTGRMVSSQLLYYATAVGCALAVTLIYLLQYGTMKLIASIKDNIYFALDFDITLLAAGFVTYLLYSFLIIAVIEFMASLLRKWRYYALIVFAASFILFVLFVDAVYYPAARVVEFFTKEPSFGMFVLKALAALIILNIPAFLINRFTVYYKSEDFSQKKRNIIFVSAVAFLAVIIFPLLWNRDFAGGGLYVPTAQELEWEQEETRRVSENRLFEESIQEIRIDVSHLPRGSKLNLASAGNVVIDGYSDRFGGAMAYFQWTYWNEEIIEAWKQGITPFDDLKGDTIAVTCYPPFYMAGDVNIFKYANPQFEAYLEGDTLYVGYSSENRLYVIIQPVWGIAKQFDMFKGKDVFTEAGFTRSDHDIDSFSGSAGIAVSVE